MTGVVVGVSPGLGRSAGRYIPQAFGADSLLEGNGFEPSVPGREATASRRIFVASITVLVPETDSPCLSRRGTDRSTKRLRASKAENAKLKRLLADAMLDNTALKDLFGKMVTPVVPGSNLVSVRAIRGSSFGQ